ncbi:peroxidase-related enzyme [Nonomuraea sp. B12E4]|uniref:carboxymuconolactone decarboxylase family protein n=1 Tax=Nonomuraea sp. B12E4 TaxID=3153564 RepID=UPI00325F856E
MPHVTIDSGEPGIRGLFAFRPETAGPLNALAEVLLRGDNTLSRGERELIAAYVSGLNECRYCTASHSAFAAAQLPEGMDLVDRVRADAAGAEISPKLRALLAIAAAVQRGGREVTGDLVAAARAEGATELEVHDTVLIAAAFCMFNRYVDGLDTHAPDDPAVYAAAAERIVTRGYGHPAAARSTEQAGHGG